MIDDHCVPFARMTDRIDRALRGGAYRRNADVNRIEAIARGRG